jgi:ABC-2 type transport system ATP-binding protein
MLFLYSPRSGVRISFCKKSPIRDTTLKKKKSALTLIFAAMSIQVSSLTRMFGTQKAVDNVSFQLNRGEIVGFLGPNGAGKSTTMRMITGYLEPDSGTATVAGINVQKEPLAAKKKIGYLPEANPLYYDMYVKEYLGFIADVHKIANKKQRIAAIIDTVGLTVESRKRTGQLSKGYKQRVGLAAALLHDPEVLILDEPTTGLDPNQIIEIRDLIKRLGANKTVLFSTHILQEVDAICDRVIIISKGKIVADKPLADLKAGTSQSLEEIFKNLTTNNN